MKNKLWKNFINSVNGLRYCWQEHSFRLEFYALCFAVPILVVLDRPVWIKLVSAASILLVLVAEAFNTAIERLCDRITLQEDEQIRQVKDAASAAVFITVLVALSQGVLLIFGTWIL